MIKFLKALKNWVSPNYWADRWAAKTGLYDSAENSRLRQWVDSLEGWQWWVWQIGVGILVFAVIETLLNTIGMTILPWK